MKKLPSYDQTCFEKEKEAPGKKVPGKKVEHLVPLPKDPPEC